MGDLGQIWGTFPLSQSLIISLNNNDNTSYLAVKKPLKWGK